MAKSDLLKEAIADAKAVKETALANAKIALQEAFMPRVENMLKTRMVHEMEGDEEEMPAEEPVDGIDAGNEEMPEGGDDFNWTDDQLSASVGGNDYDFKIGMGSDEEEMPEEMPAAQPASDEDMGAEYTEGLMHDDDLDLESIIRELEDGNEGGTDEMNLDVDMKDKEDVEAIAAEGMYYEDEEEDADINEIIEAILRENEEETMSAEPVEPEVVAEMEAELEKKGEELDEAYRTVKQLKSIINEVNLLYTNKLFRNFELSQNQKMKVIENFDRAGNPREVKLVFTTLAESFKRPATKKRVVKESAASRPTRTTAPSKQTTQVLTEGFELANRWKKLAGLL